MEQQLLQLLQEYLQKQYRQALLRLLPLQELLQKQYQQVLLPMLGLTGTPNITVGNVIGVAATFTENVSVGGTLNYEDVSNIDVVGLITARSGVEFGLVAGGTITGSGDAEFAGIVTSTKVHVGVDTGFFNEDLVVNGDARVTGILTVGSGSITLDPNTKRIEGIEEIIIGIANTITIKQDSEGGIEFTDQSGEQKSVELELQYQSILQV